MYDTCPNVALWLTCPKKLETLIIHALRLNEDKW